MERDQYVVWITTRRIKPGAYEDFRRAWRPREFPEGMLRAYECFSEERSEVVGISWWDSLEARVHAVEHRLLPAFDTFWVGWSMLDRCPGGAGYDSPRRLSSWTSASGPSTALKMSASEIVDGSRDSVNPPSGPRLDRTSSARLRSRMMSRRYLSEIS